MSARRLLCLALLVATALLLSGCDSKGSGGGPTQCTWKLGQFKAAPGVMAQAPVFSSDGRVATCDSSEPCAAEGNPTPLKPGDYPHLTDQAHCNGTYSYTLKVKECGTWYKATTSGWNNQAGWHTDNPEYFADDLGVGLWAGDKQSCAEVGWRCGCVGSLNGGPEKEVTGDLTLEVTMDTSKWPIYTVRFVPPAGATGIGPYDARNTIDHGRFFASFHPTFMLGPGAVFSLTGATSSADGEELLRGDYVV
mmetsp:Transcript_144697/g.360677  ORF Transcript_144697/g.360677 Transcript_144697/m.360677 type:complete len:250 (+) Transcript_144697:56-805(+)